MKHDRCAQYGMCCTSGKWPQMQPTSPAITKNSTSDSAARKLFTVGGLGLNEIQKSCFRFDLYSALVAFLMSEKLVRFESMWTEKHVHDKLCWRAGMENH